MENYIWICILFFLGGAIISAVYWWSVNHAERDGYKAGYAQAEREYQQRQTAAMMARFETERQMRSGMTAQRRLSPTDDRWVQVKPLGEEVKA